VEPETPKRREHALAIRKKEGEVPEEGFKRDEDRCRRKEVKPFEDAREKGFGLDWNQTGPQDAALKGQLA